MRRRLAYLLASVVLTLGALITLSLTRGQDQVGLPPGALPGAAQKGGAVGRMPESRPARDVSKLTPLGQQMALSAQRGADWLMRANRPDGRFEYGFLPALKSRMEGDHYLRQAGAAFALARAARYFGDERHTAVARQAVLTLLADTTTDEKKTVRYTTLPSMVVNRLAAAGLLVLAINELPEATNELLEQSEQLCNYIRQQQQADGSLCYTDAPGDPKASADDPDGINYYPGEALAGLMRSQQVRPAPWKTDLARKALAFYRPWWQKNKNMAFVPWQSAAFAEAYLLTGEKPFADFVAEMNDWICTLQYTMLDPRHPLWIGGFMGWMDGKAISSPPQIGSAAYAEGLAEACRAMKKAGDRERLHKYGEALERCLQFTATLQYSEANTQHFADWYRPRLLGGFHASDQDGNLRIDYTQHAICAQVRYLAVVSGE
ncbi:MAG: hypothetical protein K2R98_04205 [Gemmataceae bacterium]|nr:hypothetical protein [Gemmataceae bacterium]